jgi:enamine deaminase RidA (YjgF/YER057c/UK114 family)
MSQPPRLVDAPDLHAGVPYAYAAIAGPGEVVLTAGACPLDAAGRVDAPGDRVRQAVVVLDNLERALAAAGSSLAHVARTTVYVVASTRDELVEVWEVVAARFAPHRPPSTLLGVALLGYPDQLVEVEAIAVVAG